MVSDAVDLEKATGVRRDAKYDDDDDRSNQDDEDEDNLSVTSSSLECDNGAVVLADAQDKSPCFQNIEVTNSSDVHFGNKTYYQGPVTIKQILYTNPPNNNNSIEDTNGSGVQQNDKLQIANSCGIDNSGYVLDSVANGTVKNGNVNGLNSQWTGKSKGKKWLQNRTKKELLICMAILICIVLAVVGVTVILLTKYLSEREEQPVPQVTTGKEPDLNVPDNDHAANINIVNRRGWVAEPPKEVAPLKLPVKKVLIVETSTENCTRQGDCIFQVRHLQTDHKEGRSLWDIRYNFLVGGDGNAYEGRGWSNLGSTLPNCNENSLGIAFIGSFTILEPPDKQVNVARKLINQGVRRGLISSDYKLVFASQVTGDGVNGVRSSKKLEETVEKWPHWSDIDYYHNDTLKQNFCNS